jgi:hypothetical protein
MSESPFEETDDIPSGRKARTISQDLWTALGKSAANGKAFARTAAESVIDDLRKDLASAAVRAKYEVTTGTTALENGLHKLTFTARSKTTATAAAPPDAAAAAPDSPETPATRKGKAVGA